MISLLKCFQVNESLSVIRPFAVLGKDKTTVIPRYIAVHVSRIQYIADFSVFNVLYNVVM